MLPNHYCSALLSFDTDPRINTRHLLFGELVWNLIRTRDRKALPSGNGNSHSAHRLGWPERVRVDENPDHSTLIPSPVEAV